MTVLEEAIKFIDDLDEGYDFWSMCMLVASQPTGYVVIRPDFIGVGQMEGDTINVWLAVGEDGVRKAIELAPNSAKFAAWRRGMKDDEIHRYPIDRIKQRYGRRTTFPDHQPS